MEETVKITKKMFKAFEKVAEGGMFNMVSRQSAVEAGLTREQHRELIKNYEQYQREFKDEEEVSA